MEVNDECYCDFASRRFFGSNEMAHDPMCPQYKSDTGRRPAGSNADEWHLFLTEYCCNRPNQVNGMTYMAVQIAEAIEAAERRGREPCGECHLQPGERCDICGRSSHV